MGASSFDKPPHLFEGQDFRIQENPLKLDRPRRRIRIRKLHTTVLVLLAIATIYCIRGLRGAEPGTKSQIWLGLVTISLTALDIVLVKEMPGSKARKRND